MTESPTQLSETTYAPQSVMCKLNKCLYSMVFFIFTRDCLQVVWVPLEHCAIDVPSLPAFIWQCFVCLKDLGKLLHIFQKQF